GRWEGEETPRREERGETRKRQNHGGGKTERPTSTIERRRLQETYFALDHQDFLLLEFPFQMLLEIRQKLARSGRVLADDPVYHDLVAISYVSKFPEPLVGLREIG